MEKVCLRVPISTAMFHKYRDVIDFGPNADTPGADYGVTFTFEVDLGAVKGISWETFRQVVIEATGCEPILTLTLQPVAPASSGRF